MFTAVLEKTEVSSAQVKRRGSGASLAIQWLRLCASSAEVQAQSLVGELESHMPRDATKKNH